MHMPRFPGVDFLDFDSLLNDEEKLARQTARQFVDDLVLPIIEQDNREGTFPAQLVPQMAELGFFGANLNGYGCAGMSNVQYGLVTQEIERGDSSLRSCVSVQSALVMYPIHAYGSDAQKQKWLPILQQGKVIGCFGFRSAIGFQVAREKRDCFYRNAAVASRMSKPSKKRRRPGTSPPC
jgi:glutaryl-CoA dehydrogenase